MRTFSLTTETVEEKGSPSLTYGIAGGGIGGKVDGLDAVKQAVGKLLYTDRYEYPIYSFSYGVELKKLLGKEQTYVRAELKRMVSEALLQDDRIRTVSDFRFSFEGDACFCSFCVESVCGRVPGKLEVTV